MLGMERSAIKECYRLFQEVSCLLARGHSQTRALETVRQKRAAESGVRPGEAQSDPGLQTGLAAFWLSRSHSAPFQGVPLLETFPGSAHSLPAHLPPRGTISPHRMRPVLYSHPRNKQYKAFRKATWELTTPTQSHTSVVSGQPGRLSSSGPAAGARAGGRPP